MKDGGVLGVASHHKYVYTDLNKTEDLPGLLTGADLLVYLVTKSLDLSVIVKPVIKRNWSEEKILLESFPYNIEMADCFGEEDTSTERFECLFGSGHHVKHITWCQTPDIYYSRWQAAGFNATYGNDISVEAYYQNAAILIGIPEWGEYRKRSCGIQETSEDEGLEVGEGERPTKRHHASHSIQNPCETVLKKLCFHGEMPEEKRW